jgi:hypothetical protein
MPAAIPIVAAVAGSAVSGAMNRGANRAAANANNAAADATAMQTQIAREQYDDWKTDFQPLQRQLVGEAKDAGGAEDMARAAESAAGDVTQAFGKAKESLSSRLTSYGIDPSQGKYAAQLGDMGLSEAAANAGAQTKARETTRDKGRAFRMDVYGLGKGLPAQAGAGLASASAANTAVAANAANQASRNSAGIGALVQTAVPGLQQWWQNSGSGAPGAAPSGGAGLSGFGPPDPNG